MDRPKLALVRRRRVLADIKGISFGSTGPTVTHLLFADDTHSKLSCRTEETLSGSRGAVARDRKWNFISATTWVLPHVRSAESAELSAIRNGLYLAGRIGRRKVFVESDSIFAVEAVTRANDYMGPDVAVISECIQLAMDFASID